MNSGTRRGWGVSVTPRLLFTPGKDPVPILQEAEWAPGPVWKGAENLASTGIRSPDRPARSHDCILGEEVVPWLPAMYALHIQDAIKYADISVNWVWRNIWQTWRSFVRLSQNILVSSGVASYTSFEILTLEGNFCQLPCLYSSSQTYGSNTAHFLKECS